MLPLIPFLALLAIGTGTATLFWYEDLTREQKEEANRLTTKYARELYGKTVKQLSEQQANRVQTLVRTEIAERKPRRPRLAAAHGPGRRRAARVPPIRSRFAARMGFSCSSATARG